MAWNSQQINAGSLTNGPPTVTNPYVSVYNGQQHVGYRDAAGSSIITVGIRRRTVRLGAAP